MHHLPSITEIRKTTAPKPAGAVHFLHPRGALACRGRGKAGAAVALTPDAGQVTCPACLDLLAKAVERSLGAVPAAVHLRALHVRRCIAPLCRRIQDPARTARARLTDDPAKVSCGRCAQILGLPRAEGTP